MDSETKIICSKNILNDRVSQPADYMLESDFAASGDQPMAIEELMEGVTAGERDQVLLGVTGSGKTFTIAHVIQQTKRSTLILAPNKTLAAQLYGEMKALFPNQDSAIFILGRMLIFNIFQFRTSNL